MTQAGPASMSLTIMRGTDTLVRKAWGLADIESRRSATPDLTYRIGSTSKQFTASLILKLVDRGRLSLGDSIGRYLNGLRPEWRGITIGQLLNHTGGLQSEYRQASRRLESLPADSLIAMARRDSMAFIPGTSWGYSNTGYMLLGALVEKLYDRPYGQVLHAEIARPLGLTTLGWCNDQAQLAIAARGYDRPAQEALRPAVEVNPDLALGAGGICASSGDLTTWNRALHGGRVLAPATYAAMTTPDGPASLSEYGFGLRIHRTPWGSRVIEHGGATPGFIAENAWYPAESLSVTLLYNTSPPPANGGISGMLARIALGLPPAASQSVSDSGTMEATQFTKLTGTYELAPGLGVVISVENGGLVAEQRGRPKRPVIPQPGMTFVVGGNGPPVTIRFDIGSDGRATAMIFLQNGNERRAPRLP
ncbi:MAG: beta-lactamase [Gemmatimonadetes bacterium]|nr:beta-lactamase [Gemmatimonadota bacterium]